MRYLALMIGIGSAIAATSLPAQTVVDFEDLQLAPETAATGDASQAPFQSHGVEFNRTYSVDFDCCPGAWAYSNQTDVTQAGFGNAYSAYALPAGGGVNDSSNFAVANNFGRGDATVNFAAETGLQGVYVANTTYPYLAIADGNDGGANFVKGPFQDGDYFRLDIFGVDANNEDTGKVEVFLADFRDGRSDILSDWTWVDLSPLGDRVQRLEFDMDSTDSGMFGMNTPAYFAIDDLTMAVPEPSLTVLLGTGLVALGLRRRQRAR